MEETFQKEKANLDYTDLDNNQGGLHRRLRDRNLLQKKKTEAAEKATNQVESTRKRSRREGKSSTGKRGRPRRTEALEELPTTEGEPIAILEALPVEPGEPSSTSGYVFHPAVESSPPESHPVFVLDAPDNIPAYSLAPTSVCPPVLASTAVFHPFMGPAPSSAPIPAPITEPPPLQAPGPGLALSSAPASVLSSPSAPAPVLRSAPVPTPVFSPAPAPIPVLSPAPAPNLVLSCAPASTPVFSSAPAPTPVFSSATASGPAPALTAQQETTYAGHIDDLDRVLIKDVGTDEEEDIYPSQDYSADQELTKQPSPDESEQNKDISTPTFKSYLP